LGACSHRQVVIHHHRPLQRRRAGTARSRGSVSPGACERCCVHEFHARNQATSLGRERRSARLCCQPQVFPAGHRRRPQGYCRWGAGRNVRSFRSCSGDGEDAVALKAACTCSWRTPSRCRAGTAGHADSMDTGRGLPSHADADVEMPSSDSFDRLPPKAPPTKSAPPSVQPRVQPRPSTAAPRRTAAPGRTLLPKSSQEQVVNEHVSSAPHAHET
jgi:hypothetical protein